MNNLMTTYITCNEQEGKVTYETIWTLSLKQQQYNYHEFRCLKSKPQYIFLYCQMIAQLFHLSNESIHHVQKWVRYDHRLTMVNLK